MVHYVFLPPVSIKNQAIWLNKLKPAKIRRTRENPRLPAAGRFYYGIVAYRQ